ncbi:right-handed parallel beta-helix repeat-containing protein [uncultured Methanobrevibacter sp.]|uniref:right-handed parallel beta-helix repeat-containing protein n=1 Tax=uncultured Methanobrevibacter sp. TaxID=253161 RepID=UPI0026201A00|nr:right-handed parallel beta-helix repeat-containing protein [uncultured Methanobrevibacter sp.]
MGIGDRFKKLFKSDKTKKEDLKFPEIKIPPENEQIISEKPFEEEIIYEKPAGDDVSDEDVEVNDFDYLKSLIESGEEEILLDSDIVLGGGFESGRHEFGIRIDTDSIVIDGDGHTIDARNQTRIFFIIRGRVVLKNIVFKNALGKQKGGAIEILNENAKVVISHCTFKDNCGEGFGGAIYNKGDLTIQNCSFSGNSSNYGGAAVYNDFKVNVKDCCFLKNEVYGIGNAGIIHADGPTRIEKSRFTCNYIKSGGGVIHVSSGKTAVDECTISNGMAVYNEDGCVKIRNCLVNDNHSENVIFNNRHLGIFACRFENITGKNTVFNKGTVSILGGEFIEANVDFSVFNQGNCIINGTSFKNSIYNSSELILDDVKSDCVKPVVNDGNVLLENSADGFNDRIENNGRIDEGDCKFTFSYLTRKIFEEPAGEIILSHDINFEEYESPFYPEGIELDIDDVAIDANGHTVSGSGISRIFRIAANNVVIKNITLENGHNESGGAIYCEGKAKIIDSTFKNNSADEGGAIYNLKDMEIVKSIFSKNSADEGGAIYNIDYEDWGAKMKISSSVFKENVSAICNEYGAILDMDESFLTDNYSQNFASAVDNSSGAKMQINNCSFSNNRGDSKVHIIGNLASMKIAESEFTNNESEDVLYNAGTLDVLGVNLKNNSCKNIITNFNDSTLSVSGTNITDNDVGEATILNNAKFCSLTKTKFDNNSSDNADFKNILNKTEIILKYINSIEKIFNEGNIIVKNSPADLIDSIEGPGTVETISIPLEERYNFEYLDGLIHESESKKIILDRDISIDGYEVEFYEGGIDLDIDGLVIDGGGMTIDAMQKSRIFLVSADNIVLKNIIFKNGKVFSDYNGLFNNHGGAIRINGANVTVENCKFISNSSEGFGGAISKSWGELKIIDSMFENNESTGEMFEYGYLGRGGAVYNIYDDLVVICSKFNKNTAKMGGAIFNGATAEVISSSLNENTGSQCSCICNSGSLKIIDSTFSNNDGASVVVNEENSNVELSDCILSLNKYSVESILNHGEQHVRNTTFGGNEKDRGYVNSSSQYCL